MFIVENVVSSKSIVCTEILYMLFGLTLQQRSIMMAEIKVPFGGSPELSRNLSAKSGVQQNIALHASPTTRNSVFLISTFLAHSTSFFLNPLSARKKKWHVM